MGWAAAGILLGAASHALELRAGDIVVTEPLAGEILRIDPVTGAKDVITRDGELWVPIGMALESDGQLIVADSRSGRTGAILRVDPGTGAQQVLSRGVQLKEPIGVVVGPSGDLFVSTDRGGRYGEGGVLRIDPESGAPTFVYEETERIVAGGLALDAGGRLVAGLWRRQPTHLSSEVYGLDPETGDRQRISVGGDLFSPWQIAIDREGRILVAELVDNLIVRIDPETGAQERVPLELPGLFSHGLRALAFESDGSLLVLSSRRGGEGLYRIEQEGDAPTLIAPLIRPLGMLVVPGRRIRVDVGPVTRRDPVAIGSSDVFPVAILGSGELDVTTVDPDSLVFGPGDAERAHPSGPHFLDVNGDGGLDLLVHFLVREAEIGVGDTEACLSGSLLDGTEVAGCDGLEPLGGCGGGFAVALLVPIAARAGRRLRGDR